MNTPELYNLSPLLSLMLMGLTLAIGPLAWVWLRHHDAKGQVSSTQRRLHALTLITLFLTFDLVLFGSFTRLTDSGLGCPDWPGCYGHSSPVGAQAHITAAQAVLPSGPVTHGKAWVEMIHRYLATSVGVLILVLAAATWWARLCKPESKTLNPWWPTATLVWVCVQGAFGALTVTMKLFPAIVTLHLLGGLFLLALLCVQTVRYKQSGTKENSVTPSSFQDQGLRALMAFSLALLVAQIAVGGWVSTNYAVLACTDFPLCQNSVWPAMNFAQGFTLWRELGLTPQGLPIDFAALTAIHYTHRLMAYLVITLLVVLAWRMQRQPAWRKPAHWLVALTGLQFLTGLSNVVLDWPLFTAVLHTGGAAALVIVLTWSMASFKFVQKLRS
jgi:cytochrome c oxidase assembly protein subunit 15